jgi:ureidoacrylate peracid hydrolase
MMETFDEPLDPRRTAVLFFDALNGHLKTGPGRTVPDAFQGAVVKMRRVLDAARAAGCMVVYAAGSHRPDGAMEHRRRRTDTDNRLRPSPQGNVLGKQPVIAGDWTSAVIDELAPSPEDFVVPKFRWSAFAGTYLDMALAGGSTDVGVAATAFSARDLDYDLVVVHDACTAHELDNHEQFMKRIFPRMARVRDTAAVEAMLRPSGDAPRGR